MTSRLTARGRAGVLAAIAAAALLAAGCAATNPYPLNSWARAKYFADHKKPREATTACDQFLRHSPSDTLAPQAQLLKARQLMELKEYPLAVVELQILRQEYPASDYVPESWLLEGVSLVKQVGRVERDITPAIDARSRFQTFLTLHPDTVRAAEARRYLNEIADLVLRKKLGEAEVFAQLGRYEAAGVILDRALAEEKEGSLRPQVLMRRAQIAVKAKDSAAAASAWREVVASYPESAEARSARDELKRLGPTAGGGS